MAGERGGIGSPPQTAEHAINFASISLLCISSLLFSSETTLLLIKSNAPTGCQYMGEIKLTHCPFNIDANF